MLEKEIKLVKSPEYQLALEFCRRLENGKFVTPYMETPAIDEDGYLYGCDGINIVIVELDKDYDCPMLEPQSSAVVRILLDAARREMNQNFKRLSPKKLVDEATLRAMKAVASDNPVMQVDGQEFESRHLIRMLQVPEMEIGMDAEGAYRVFQFKNGVGLLKVL